MEKGFVEFWMCLGSMFLLGIAEQMLKRGFKKLNFKKLFLVLICPYAMFYIAWDLWVNHSSSHLFGRFSIDNFSIMMSICIFVAAVVIFIHIIYEIHIYLKSNDSQ